jgi:hypothetical protein
MKNLKYIIFIFITSISFLSCSDIDDTEPEPMLIINFKFDPNQERLNNLGEPVGILLGNSAQTPVFNSISSHYIELAQNQFTQLGQGAILYKAPETTIGGDNAIDFSQSKIVGEGETFIEIPLKTIRPGTYEWLRSSLSYQNFQIKVRHQNADYTGTLASFVGFNTYIGEFSIGNSSFPVNSNKLQGFWAFALNDFPYMTSGQAPANATTVPNPIAATSPIPAGSCVVTGKFATPLEITGYENSNITVTLSLSINHSFEWKEVGQVDGKYQPSNGETVVDMGLRGLIPSFVKK